MTSQKFCWFYHTCAPSWHTTVQALLSFLDAALSSAVPLILLPLCLYYHSLITSVRLLKRNLYQFIPPSNSLKTPNRSKSQLSQWFTRLYRVWSTPLILCLYFLFLIVLASAILNSPGANQDLSHWPLWLPEIPSAESQGSLSQISQVLGWHLFPLLFSEQFYDTFSMSTTCLIYNDTPSLLLTLFFYFFSFLFQ